MFGNKEGWILSAVIAGLLGWMFLKLGRLEPIPAPSGQFANLSAPVQLPVAPADAVPGVMTEDRDAGEQYWQAIELFRKFPTDYRRSELSNTAKVARLPALNLVIEGASAKRANLFAQRPEVLVNYKFPWPELDAISELGQFCNSVGHYYVVRKPDEKLAKRYLHAGFSLGAKLFDERVTHAEMMAGVKLMQGAVLSLKELAKQQKDAARLAALDRFANETSAWHTPSVNNLYQKINSTERNDLLAHAGDVFEVAQTHPDRMWRVEAILKLGRYRYNAPRRSDQVWAQRMLGDKPERWGFADPTKDPDPAVKTAAAAAKGLTLDQYRGIR